MKLFMLVVVTVMLLFITQEAAYAISENGRGPRDNPNAIPPGFSNGGGERPPHKADPPKGPKSEPRDDKPRWSYNPLDERGQGNMGRPDMRDPYGFDKDSDRVAGERGRRIIEPALNLEAITGFDLTITDAHLVYLQAMYDGWTQIADENPWHPFARPYAEMFKRAIDRYLSAEHQWLTVGFFLPAYGPSTIDYDITFTPPEEFEGTTLLVTTVLTTLDEYNGEYGLHYDAGQVIVEETQETVLGADNTLAVSYVPPSSLVDRGVGFLAELSFVITEPESGETHIITHDEPLYLYRFGSLASNW
jgi:hypothetical protein